MEFLTELELDRKHRNTLKGIKNPFINKYLGNIQVFHDCIVDQIFFNPINSSLSIKMTIWHRKKKFGSYLVVFSNIFEINFKHEIEGDDQVLKLLNFKKYFNMEYSFEFLYCFFDTSPFNKFSKKYLKCPAYRSRIIFLNSLIITIDFTKIEIKGSLSMLDKFIKFGWYRVDSE